MGGRGELEGQFLSTDYVVDDGPVRLVINVGRRCADLDRLLAEEGASEWAYITAYNPGAKLSPTEENRARQQELCEMVRERGCRFLHGYGRGASGEWPPEPSLLVIGLGRDNAVALARRFGQAAIVAGRVGGVAELIWCD